MLDKGPRRETALPPEGVPSEVGEPGLPVGTIVWGGCGELRAELTTIFI
jgi:hypothetical protein